MCVVCVVREGGLEVVIDVCDVRARGEVGLR